MCDSFGGVSSPFSTPFNTPGMGDVMPCGAYGFGSGDRSDLITQKLKPKKNSPKGSTTTLETPPLIVYTNK